MSEPYASSPIFDEQTLPDALRNDHRTKTGTWGLLRVLEGEVRLIFTEPLTEHRVTPDVRRQNIWHRSRRKLAECGPRLLLGF
ncbi:DUF1971 domain-containing protein, partial [Sphingomonas aquatica]|uniref:DUF1971 domain-containing protein n=2 Tax=Sphingomonas TaxID=13687 RepID=UPI00301E1012